MKLIDKYISKEVSGNFFWLIFDKVLASAMAFVIYFVVARYLGPDSLGEYNYALSIVTIFSTFAVLGIDSVLIRDLVSSTVNKAKILGTIYYSKLVGSIILIIVSSIVVWISKHNPTLSIMVVILSTGYMLRSVLVLDSWFLAKNDVKASVIARSVAVVVIAIVKIVFVVSKLNVIYFAVATTLEVLVTIAVLIYLFNKKGEYPINKWSFDKEYFISFAKKNWYLFAGGFLAAFTLRFDQYLLGTMISEKSVGLYSPAVKFSEIWSFVPLAFINAVYPTLISTKQKSIQRFEEKFIQTISISFWLTIIFCFGIFLGAEKIIDFSLGSDFFGSVSILKIYIWSTVGSMLTSVWGRWVVIEDQSWTIAVLHIVSFILNIGLNLFLIPKYGVIGAAWATVISYNIGGLLVMGLSYRGVYFIKLMFSAILFPLKKISQVLVK